MDTGYLIVIYREQTVGVFVAEVLFCREGEVGDVVDTLDVIESDASFVEPLAVEGDVLVGVFDRLSEPLRLQFTQLCPIKGLIVVSHIQRI